MKSRLLVAALVASVATNALLAYLLATRTSRTVSAPAATAQCTAAKADIDFFIEGLDREQDGLYSPLLARSLAHLVEQCRPENSDEIQTILVQLRTHLNKLVASGTSADDRVVLRKEARALFVALRDVGT
jgi:hypothetical protein